MPTQKLMMEALIGNHLCPPINHGWVLGRVGRLMAQLRRGDRVKGYIAKNPNDFSRYRYQQAFQQIQKGA